MGVLDMEGAKCLRLYQLTTDVNRREQAENADEWSYQKGLQGGWIPQDPTNRMYPGICS